MCRPAVSPRLLIALAWGLVPPSANAQVAWSRLAQTGPTPTAVEGAEMVYDSRRDRLVLFGGRHRNFGTTRYPDDTWEFDGTAWQLRATPVRPPGRAWFGMVYDSARGVTVLFGGDPQPLRDTWEWNGNTWRQRFPTTVPPWRRNHAIAYDRVRARAVMFGGSDGTDLDDTWEWDGTDWLLRQPVNSPPGRQTHAMAAGAGAGTVLLHGGVSLARLADLWSWDGNTWTEIKWSRTGPGSRQQHAMSLDLARSRVVLHAGLQLSLGTRDDVWEWDGSVWHARTPAVLPMRRRCQAMAYDAMRERIVMFGGDQVAVLDDTWEYAPTQPAAIAPFGQACTAEAGTPRLAAATRPWLGETLRTHATNLGAVPFALVFVGFSNTAAGVVPLPAELTVVGMPGCTLYTSLELTVPVVVIAGRAEHRILVPPDPLLLGTRFFEQVLVAAPGANAFGAVLSNALAGVVGGL